MRRFAIAACVLALVAGAYVHRHPGVPRLHTVDVTVRPLPAVSEDWVKLYPETCPMQVAVVWTDPAEHGLGLIHSLKQMGIPFFVTRHLKQALSHKQMIVYPSIDGRTFRAEELTALQHWVEGGGSLWSQHVAAGGMRPIMGFDSVKSVQTRHRIDFVPGSDPMMAYLDRPEEQTISLGAADVSQVIWSDGYTIGHGAKALAHFEDGSVAFSRLALGRGTAYLCGVGLDDVVARPEANRDFEAQRYYADRHEPGADVWRLMLRAWYESKTAGWVRLSTMPSGLRSTLVLTHDVDWEYAVKNCIAFADMEASLKHDSTFFMQTKYLDDANSHAFFYGRSLDYSRELKERHFDIESHSVIHAMGFNHFPLGTGDEKFATYRAVAVKGGTFPGGTVYGELKVSKSILDGEIPGQHTICFRAGHLRVPPQLPQTLARCGYEFDSSFTAGDTMTNFPYPLTRDLDFSNEVPIYEFPVTIEDEASPLLDRIPQSLDLIKANADNGALTVLLIHPSDTKDKVAAERQMLEQLPPGVGVSDFVTFARFWRARDHLRWEVRGRTLTVHAREAVSGLTFNVGQPLASVSGSAQLGADHKTLVLPDIPANGSLTVELKR